MPIIAYYSDRNAAQEAFNLLELNGVPPYLKSAATWSDPERMALVVLFPEQVDDAIRLLEDPDYEVSNPVDMEMFYEVEGSGDALKVIGRYAIYTLVGVVTFLAFILVLDAYGVVRL